MIQTAEELAHVEAASNGRAPKDKANRYEALDSLRGFCACMVALVHFRTTGAINSSGFIQHSYLFVDFFFVLSGFVIASSYLDKIRGGFPIRKFMLLRLGRVYPLHIVMLAAFLVFEVTASLLPSLSSGLRAPFTGEYSLPSLFASLGLVQIFIGDEKSAAIAWNFPSWSIAAELWTYLLFAALFRFARPGRAFALTGLCALLYLLVTSGERHLNDIHAGAFARCVFGFSLGALVCLLRRKVSLRGGTSAVEILTTVLALAGVYLTGATEWEFLMPFIFAWSIYLFSHESGVVSRFMKTPPFLLLGALSYSIYMTHAFVSRRLANLVEHFIPSFFQAHESQVIIGNSTMSGDAMSILYLLVVIGFSWLTYRLIEQPGRRWSRKAVLTNRPQSRAAAQADAAAF